MTYYILITLCIIVLIAYLFEVTAKYSKIPSVILLMMLGLGLRYLATHLAFSIPDLSFLLPIMGTLGLILIVLEGSLDLTINREKMGLIAKSSAAAIILFGLFIVFFAILIRSNFTCSFKTALLNAIPFGIISSAVAIPSSTHLKKDNREFIIYESSISDIIGILVFDFLLFSSLSLGKGLVFFSFEVIVSLVFSVIISAGLALMLHKIGQQVKYVIILSAVILIFTLAKLIHWPALIVVLIFGLIMNNNHLFQKEFILKRINFEEFNLNLKSFKQITGELTFLVRSFFFLIFGFYTSIAELFNLNNLLVSTLICAAIFLLRGLFFKFILRKPLAPLFYFAPRGLITILLFLSLPGELKMSFLSEGLITQTIFITIIVMAIGNMLVRQKNENALKGNEKPPTVS